MILRRFLLMIVASAFWGLPAGACDVPVFSYAMQYWAPDPYRVYVFHSEPLSAADQRVVDQFRAVGRHTRLETNMVLHVVDLQKTADASVRDIYRAHEDKGGMQKWAEVIATLREQNRRLPALQDELNRAQL